MAQPRGELAGLLTVGYPKTRVADMALEDDLRQRIDRVLVEQRQRERIREHGFAPLRKLLLVGPPGTGKTMTAAALAGELGLPLFTIQLDGLITKYMGETAAKLRLVFDAMQATRGVYLFDEFDALGGQRGGGNDVGEIRRVLNSFLQFLEMDDSDSLVIGATNHVKLLDRALFRRFDAVLEYELPSQQIATQVMRARLGLLDTSAGRLGRRCGRGRDAQPCGDHPRLRASSEERDPGAHHQRPERRAACRAPGTPHDALAPVVQPRGAERWHPRGTDATSSFLATCRGARSTRRTGRRDPPKPPAPASRPAHGAALQALHRAGRRRSHRAPAALRTEAGITVHGAVPGLYVEFDEPSGRAARAEEPRGRAPAASSWSP